MRECGKSYLIKKSTEDKMGLNLKSAFSEDEYKHRPVYESVTRMKHTLFILNCHLGSSREP